ncbi:hypothetical protein L1049_017441 [Liquidambar formosana]|uniref:SAGA-associated factor 11 n=1 Tax=Liquidambar formosana TaxID=63359 RepID=A0AAP0X878_LIQFO
MLVNCHVDSSVTPFPLIIASPYCREEVGNQKLIAQYIHRELREADEANLLDEEDMHVFDLKPMTDPLHLVRCNSCKKPVKASQYAAHAELCRSLSSTEEAVLEVDGGTGHKKPPRKERKKLLSAYANQSTIAGEHERSECVEADDTVASESHLDEQVGTTSSFSMQAKRNLACVDVAPIMDNSGVTSGMRDHSAVVVPPTKRSKLIAAERLLLSEGLETACGVTKIISSQEAYTCMEFPKESSAGSERPYDHVVRHHKPVQLHEHCPLTKDVPVPLATKMYYSQRNHRLRSALSLMYYEASSKEHCSDLESPKVLHGNLMPPRVSSPKNSYDELMDDQPEKKRDMHSLPSVRNPDQILAQSSEVCLGKAGGYPPAMSFSNQFPVNNVLRQHTAPVGMLRSKYLAKPYSFAGNSGTPLGTMQQPNGSVPVI